MDEIAFQAFERQSMKTSVPHTKYLKLKKLDRVMVLEGLNKQDRY
jgi:hypothetical protein